jgi:hypothetical protein
MNMYARNTPFQNKGFIVTYDFIITLYNFQEAHNV